MTDNPSLRILHISDLHFTSSSRKEPVWGQQTGIFGNIAEEIDKIFLNHLKRFLGRFSEDQWPKIVIVSGDLVEKGGHEIGEFARATQFLSDLASVLKISEQKRIFVVPGNHDVNWYKGVDIEQRFEDYFNAVEKFSSPELSRRGLKLHHEDLSNIVQDISLELTLFISPTYSGVPDETVNEIKRRVSELQEKIREVQAGVDAEIHEDFKLLDIAAIGADQRRQIQTSNHADKEPIRIAVLHHHLLPDNQLEVSQFESVVDAGRTIDELIANKYDLVLTGHKHNRRLVHLRNANGAIDVYTSPSLFKDEGRGFTIIDVHKPTSSYYATLHYYDYKCDEILPQQRLVREGRILPQVSEACADISPPDQQEILLPVLDSVKSYTNSANNPPFEKFFRGVWEQVSEDLKNIGQQRLVFRSPRIWEQWQNLVQLAQDNNEPIKLVSKNDLDYWIAAAERPLSEPDNYSQPLRQFQGEKLRIIILDKPYFEYTEEREKCIKVVNNMIEQKFSIALVPVRNILSTEIMQDFGIIGNFAVSIFEGRDNYTRSLKENLNQDDLTVAKRDWNELWQNRVWDSSGIESIEQFLNRFQY